MDAAWIPRSVRSAGCERDGAKGGGEREREWGGRVQEGKKERKKDDWRPREGAEDQKQREEG